MDVDNGYGKGRIVYIVEDVGVGARVIFNGVNVYVR